jgi:hypothetical protein
MRDSLEASLQSAHNTIHSDRANERGKKKLLYKIYCLCV